MGTKDHSPALIPISLRRRVSCRLTHNVVWWLVTAEANVAGLDFAFQS